MDSFRLLRHFVRLAHRLSYRSHASQDDRRHPHMRLNRTCERRYRLPTVRNSYAVTVMHPPRDPQHFLKRTQLQRGAQLNQEPAFVAKNIAGDLLAGPRVDRKNAFDRGVRGGRPSMIPLQSTVIPSTKDRATSSVFRVANGSLEPR